MSNPLVQIGDEVREMTAAELAQAAADREQMQLEIAAAEAVATAKASARAKLKALGLTDAEIAALVG